MTHVEILIIGAGQAGGQLTRSLLAPESGYEGSVALVGEEAHLPYERPPLSKAALKDAALESDAFTIPPEIFDDPRLVMTRGDRVTMLDPVTHRARLASGRVLTFGKAVLATGGHPAPLPLPGSELCHGLRTLDDARALRDRLAPGLRLVILGGGVIGMEVAATAREKGATVTVIEAGSRLMARCLPPAGSDWLEARHAEAGATILKRVRAERIEKTGSGVAVQLSDGNVVQADLVLAATGIRPSATLAPADSIGASGGIRTDAFGAVPGHPDLYALGDVAECHNGHLGRSQRLETWRNADRHAKALARTLAGTPTPHVEIPWMWTDQLGHNVQVFGLWSPTATELIRGPVGEAGAAILWLEDGRLGGGMLIDNRRDRRPLEKLIEARPRLAPDLLADPAIPLKSLLKGPLPA